MDDFHKLEEFRKELASLINKYSLENYSNSPDFILAQYMTECLLQYGLAKRLTENWMNKK